MSSCIMPAPPCLITSEALHWRAQRQAESAATLAPFAVAALVLTNTRLLTLQPFSWIDQTFIHPPAPEETGEADVPEAAKK